MKKSLKLISLILILITVVALFTVPTSAASVTYPAEGDYYITASSNNGFCVDVMGGSTSQKTYVHLWSKVEGCAAQIFTIKREYGQWYTIRNKATGLCLNVPNNNAWTCGQQLWMYRYDGTNACLWRFLSVGNGRVTIQNKSGYVLDLDNNLLYNGSRLHLWSQHNGNSAKWKLVSANTSLASSRVSMSNGIYKILPTSNQNRCLNIQYKSTSTGSANTVLDTFNSETNEQFQVSSVGNNYYTIAPKHCSGRYLCVSGSKITLSSSSSSYASQWYFVRSGSGYIIVNRSTNKALAVYSYSVGTTVNAASPNTGASEQNFTVSKVSAYDELLNARTAVSNGTYKILPTYNQNRCLNIQYKSTSTGSANTVLDTYNSETNEQFVITGVGNNFYTIAPKHCSGRYLCVSGSKVTLSSSSSSYYSQWYFVKYGNGYAILNRATNKALAVYAYNVGTTVNAASPSIGTKAQNFVLSQASTVMSVPLFKQKDARWANTYIGTKTIGAIGCTTTCISMVYSYHTGKTVYPNEIRNILSYSNNDLKWSSLGNVGLSYKTYDCGVTTSMLKTIYSKLQEGRPVIIGATAPGDSFQHWVVITGYTGSGTSFSTADFVINDPGQRGYTTLAEFFANGSSADRTFVKKIMY